VADPSVDDPKKIYDANSVAIKTILEAAGCEVSYCGVAADEPEKLNELLLSLANFDLIVSSGGVSAGDFDYFARIPEKLGIKWLVQHVRQRPAQPVCYGTVHGTPFFALPGTPVGAFLCATLYVKPAARCMAGESEPWNTFFTGLLQESADKRVECTQFNMAKSVTVDGILKVTPYPLANYSLKLLAKGNSFARLTKPETGKMLPGESVDVLFF
jgi:molybdopterin molybdotransferase